MGEANQTAQRQQYLSFLIAGDEYALGILQAKEIIQYDTVTRVPKTPTWVRGVINLRGGVVPVVDLAARFGLGHTEAGSETCIVIAELELDGGPMLVGVLADSVSRVIDLRPEEIEQSPAFGTRVDVDYLRGLGKVEERFVLLLDLEKVLAAEDLIAGQAQTTGAGEAEDASEPAETIPPPTETETQPELRA